MSALLSHREAVKAAKYNERKARVVGWAGRWSAVCTELEVADGTIKSIDFAQKVAKWQENNEVLPHDGMFGKDTWRAMKKKSLKHGKAVALPSWLPKAPKSSPIVPLDFAPGESPWMEIARREKMKHWRRADGSIIHENETDRDINYFAATPYFGGKEQAAGRLPSSQSPEWCSAFVNYCLHTAGYSHTGSAGAMSFVKRDWAFKSLKEPKRGCVIVIKKGGLEHVAFLDEWIYLPPNPNGNVSRSEIKGVKLLGGNQGILVTDTGHRWKSKEDGDKEKVDTLNSKYFRWEMQAARGENGVLSPYLWPLQGAAGFCNCDLPTARPHQCWAHWK